MRSFYNVVFFVYLWTLFWTVDFIHKIQLSSLYIRSVSYFFGILKNSLSFVLKNDSNILIISTNKLNKNGKMCQNKILIKWNLVN